MEVEQSDIKVEETLRSEEPLSPYAMLSESLEKINNTMEKQLEMLHDKDHLLESNSLENQLKSEIPIVRKIHHSTEMHEYLRKKLAEMRKQPIIYVNHFQASVPNPKEAIEEYADSEHGYQTEPSSPIKINEP